MAQPCGFAGFTKVGKKWAQPGQSGQKYYQNVLTLLPTTHKFYHIFTKNPLWSLSYFSKVGKKKSLCKTRLNFTYTLTTLLQLKTKEIVWGFEPISHRLRCALTTKLTISHNRMCKFRGLQWQCHDLQ